MNTKKQLAELKVKESRRHSRKKIFSKRENAQLKEAVA